MFHSNMAFQEPDCASCSETQEIFDIESILMCSTLPEAVRTARIVRTSERLIDEDELLRLTDMDSNGEDQLEFVERIRVRRKALSDHLGSVLICAVIRMPGVNYTLEFDPTSKSIVHYEWQRT